MEQSDRVADGSFSQLVSRVQRDHFDEVTRSRH